MADSATSNFNLVLVEVGASNDTWGNKLNANFTDIDALLTGASMLSRLLTVDGSGSGLDADKLRNVTPSAFALTLLDDADAAASRATLGAMGHFANALSPTASPEASWLTQPASTIGLTVNSTGSTNFPNEFGATVSFAAGSGQRRLDLFKMASDALAIYVRGYNNSNVPQNWEQIWTDASPLPNAKRTAIGLEIGTNVQAYHSNLTALAGLALIADRLPYANGAGTLGLTPLTAAGRALIDDLDAAAQRATLGLSAAATTSLGTAGAVLALLNTNNTHGGNNLFQGTVGISGAATFSGTITQSYGTFGDGLERLRVAATDYGANKPRLSLENLASGAWRFYTYDGSDFDGEIGFATGTFAIGASLATYGGLEIGYRDTPIVTGGLERGKCFETASGFTVNTGPAAGSTFVVYNNSGSSFTLTQGAGLTMRLGGTTTTGSRTLLPRGYCTILFRSTTECIVSGPGVS